MLWTDTRRYIHLSGRSVEPSGVKERGAVNDLNANGDERASEFVEKIALSHKHKLLNHVELRNYVWSDSSATWNHISVAILDSLMTRKEPAGAIDFTGRS